MSNKATAKMSTNESRNDEIIVGPRQCPPIKRSKFSLPGLALAHRTYDGFGKELFVPSSEDDADIVKELEGEFGFDDD